MLTIRLAAIFVLTSIACRAQDSIRVRSAAEDLERVRELVAVGAAPRHQLELAEEKLQEAKQAQSLDTLLFSQVKIEELTESQAKEMVEAATGFVDREKLRLDQALKMVENGLRPKHSLEPFEDNLTRANHTLGLAKSRASLVQELVAIVMAEKEAAEHPAEPETPKGPKPVFEKFDGKMAFSTAELKQVMLAYEKRFSSPLPISARGETAVHKALGYDHRGRVDVGLQPDGEQGLWLRHYLEVAKIPYFAFRKWVPGQATAPHIHIGPPSTRLVAD